MKAILLATILGVIIFISCNNQITESECACAGQAVNVALENEKGIEIYADSIKYRFNNDEIFTIKANVNQNLYGTVGSHPGEYTIWAYYKGIESDSINVSVSMGGPSGCRRPSTKEVRIIFNEIEYESYELKKIGGCGE